MFNDITSGLRIPSQEPLDLKTYCLSQAILANLGVMNNLAFTYYEGMIVYCVAEKSKWLWREVEIGETGSGLRTTNFTYPAGLSNNGVNYSNRVFNFFRADATPTLQQVLTAGNVADKNIVLQSGTVQTTLRPDVIVVKNTNPDQNVSMSIYPTGIYSHNTNINNVTNLTYLGLPVNPGNNVSFTTPLKPTGNYILATTQDVTSIVNLAIAGLPAVIIPPFQAVDEGNGIGFIVRGRNAAKFGNVGWDAIDFSTNSTLSTTHGATGSSSFAVGENVKATGYASVVFGYNVVNNGVGSFNSGFNLRDTGYLNTLLGVGHNVTSIATTVVGQAANIITDQILDMNITITKPLFVVGNGTIENGEGSEYEVLTRSDAFIVRLNGVATLPTVTNALITAEPTGKAVITREYLESTTNNYLKVIVVYVAESPWWVNQQYSVYTGVYDKTIIGVTSFFECIVAHDNYVIGDTIDTPRPEAGDSGGRGPQGVSVQFKSTVSQTVYVSIGPEIALLPAFDSGNIEVNAYLIPDPAKWKVKLVVVYV